LDQQGQSQSGHPNLAEAPSVTAKKFWYDTVCYGSKAAFTCALEAFGADHLVTGSDYPVLQDMRPTKRPSPISSTWGCPKPTPTRSCTTMPRSFSASSINRPPAPVGRRMPLTPALPRSRGGGGTRAVGG